MQYTKNIFLVHPLENELKWSDRFGVNFGQYRMQDQSTREKSY